MLLTDLCVIRLVILRCMGIGHADANWAVKKQHVGHLVPAIWIVHQFYIQSIAVIRSSLLHGGLEVEGAMLIDKACKPYH